KEHTKEYIEQVQVMAYQEKKQRKKKGPQVMGIGYERSQRQALFEVTVTDEKWIQHLITGMVWHTASYEISKGTTGVRTKFCCEFPEVDKPRAQAKFE